VTKEIIDCGEKAESGRPRRRRPSIMSTFPAATEKGHRGHETPLPANTISTCEHTMSMLLAAGARQSRWPCSSNEERRVESARNSWGWRLLQQNPRHHRPGQDRQGSGAQGGLLRYEDTGVSIRISPGEVAQDLGITVVDLNELLAASDFITVPRPAYR